MVLSKQLDANCLDLHTGICRCLFKAEKLEKLKSMWGIEWGNKIRTIEAGDNKKNHNSTIQRIHHYFAIFQELIRYILILSCEKNVEVGFTIPF